MKKILNGVLKKHILLFIVETLLITINIYLLTVPSKLLGKIIDYLYSIEINKQIIINTTFNLLLISLCILIARLLWKMIDAKISRNIVKDVRDRLFEKMLKTDLTNIEEMKNGDIMAHFVRDINQIRKFVSNAVTSSIRFVLNFVIVFIAMINLTNMKLALISILPIVISIILIIIKIRKLEIYYNESRKKYTKLSEYVQESTDSIRTTKAYVGEKKQYQEFLKINDSFKNTEIDVIRNETILSIYMNMGIGLGLGISLLLGSNMVLNNEISIGEFVAFNGYMLILENPIRWIPWLIKHFKKFKVSYKRLDNMFKLREENIQIDNNNNKKLKGNIEINNLDYIYPNCAEKVLKNINIKIEEGKSLGIIGVIGSGKTTLMNLLLKLYDVPRGKIFIDGKDINDIELNQIRNNICYITQDNFIFSTSVKDNINLFRDIYDEEDIIKSTKSSMIYDEIKEMSHGINTIIGEKGIDLSGGQKQRVVISRAFLSNSNIVIFDDTFSALDNKTEEQLLRNIIRFTENKTCIIISNRISDIKHCDEIVVFENGKIIERGIHRDLLTLKSKYYEFYKNQAEKSKVEILN